MPVLGGVESAQPRWGWECRPFKYETSRSQLETFEDSRRAVIYLARSPDGRQSVVNFQSSDNSGWHGKCVIRDDAIMVTFNWRGLQPWHATFCQRAGDAYLGYEYAGRAVRITPLRELWHFRHDEWQLALANIPEDVVIGLALPSVADVDRDGQ